MSFKRKRVPYHDQIVQGPFTKRKMARRSRYVNPKRLLIGPAPAGMNLRTGGFLGRENKFYDTSLCDATVATSADTAGGEADPSATVLFNTVAQGVTEEQRIGRQIHMQSVQLKGIIHMAPQINQTILDIHPTVALYLVLDTQTNGTTIASEDVFKNKGADIALATSLFRDLEQVQRFKILKTVTVKLQPIIVGWDGTNLEQSGSNSPFSIYANLKNLVVNYCGTTSDVANITDNSLHLLAFSSNAELAPKIHYNARLRFNG